jgi:MFS family permease
MMFFLGNLLVFKWLIFYILIFTVFHHPLGPLIDALAVQFSKTKPERYNFGNLRLWGSLGWAVASILGGYLFSMIDIRYLFPTAALFFLISVFFLRLPSGKSGTIYHPDFSPLQVSILSGNKTLVILIVILFLYGVVCSPVNAFINLYFSELNSSNVNIGWAYAIQSLSEIPFFLVGNLLCKRFGARSVIIVSMIAMVIRMFLYGLIPVVAIALMLGIFQGITLSFFLVGVVDFIHKQLPDGRDATAQSLIWGLYFGIGHTVGNLITGYLKDMVGMIDVMYYFAWIALSVLIFSVVFFYSRKIFS